MTKKTKKITPTPEADLGALYQAALETTKKDKSAPLKRDSVEELFPETSPCVDVEHLPEEKKRLPPKKAVSSEVVNLESPAFEDPMAIYERLSSEMVSPMIVNPLKAALEKKDVDAFHKKHGLGQAIDDEVLPKAPLLEQSQAFSQAARPLEPSPEIASSEPEGLWPFSLSHSLILVVLYVSLTSLIVSILFRVFFFVPTPQYALVDKEAIEGDRLLYQLTSQKALPRLEPTLDEFSKNHQVILFDKKAMLSSPQPLRDLTPQIKQALGLKDFDAQRAKQQLKEQYFSSQEGRP